MSRFPAPSIETVDELNFVREDFVWEFEHTQAHLIDMHWGKLCADKPLLFNGRVLLMHRGEVVEEAGKRVFRGACFETDFKAFIAWRDFGFPDPQIRNFFAMAALVSADGAFMLGEQGGHTANAGKIYFAAGTPDPDDLNGNILDLAGSSLRELREETGLLPDQVRLAPQWHVVFEGPRIACMRIARCVNDAATMQDDMLVFVASDKEPELDRLYPVRSATDIHDELMPAFTQRYLRWAFDNNLNHG